MEWIGISDRKVSRYIVERERYPSSYSDPVLWRSQDHGESNYSI